LINYNESIEAGRELAAAAGEPEGQSDFTIKEATQSALTMMNITSDLGQQKLNEVF
jgi:hypothetical protein